MDSENIADRLSHLSPAKRALLELKLRQNGVDRASSVTIPRRVNRDSAPLSFAQQRLWFINQLEPESPAYNEMTAVCLEGALSIEALKGALNAIVERHEVLRTTYAMLNDGIPQQIIGTAQPVDLPIFDISDLAENRRDDEVQRIAANLKGRLFDLRKDAPLRLALIKLTTRAHILVTVKHHIASDGWSSGVFSRELAVFYGSFSEGRPNPLPEPSLQYADYAVWQREWLQGEVLEKQLAHWKRQLQNVPVLELPTDRPRAALQSDRGARQFLNLSKTLSDRLKALSHQEGATLFMTLLAGFQILLRRYTGQDDIAVGSPIAGRTRPETEGLIGFFVNTLVFRNDLSGDPTFREFLAQVRESALKAYEHQDLPFEKLVEDLNPVRDSSHSPVFQVLFAVQNLPRREFELPGLIATPVEIGSVTSKFDIFAAFIERDGQLVLRMDYRTDLFDDTTIGRMLSHFQTLLEGIVEEPDQRLSALQLLSSAERHQLLVEWNDTKREYPKDKCIHQWFEEQVEKSPDAVAAVFEDQQLTYQELNRRANQLAHHLNKRGVGPATLVALCVERSIETVVGVLAILKAGGAYVPMDPEYPRERLAFMLSDSQASVLLTHERLSQMLPEYSGQKVCFDQDRDSIVRESGENLSHDESAQSLAYVIYTSGSTGKPKGVMIEHRSAVAFLTWAHRVFTKDDFSDVVASTSICFDLSVFELFAPLTSGGRVILVENALALGQLDRAVKPTLINTVPSVMAELLRLREFPPSIRTVNLAGEPLKTGLVEAIYRQTSVRQVYDLYGPSETTTYSTYTHRTAGGIQTIGRPIDNTQVYILDSHLKPVPIGVSGELYIGGAGLARGYLNRPELTAEKFVPHPFDDKAGARLYRTGDLARYLPDGNIEYLGRIDNQVKIRGYRIELGEIEAVLNQHPAVRECAVVVREESYGDSTAGKRLVAYVVADQRVSHSTTELQKGLKQKLPEYMVPSVFMYLESLPLTPNGKLDRRALPSPDQSRAELDGTFIAPRTPVEELLAEIWAEVLKIDKVSVQANFFDLGGHSLLATQIVSRMRDSFRQAIPLRALFEAPTVAELAGRVEAVQHQATKQKTPVVSATTRDQEPPLSFAQQRLWFLDQLEPNSAVYNVPIARRLRGQLDLAALKRSVNAIVQRHEALRTIFITSDGQPIQRIMPSLTITVAVVDLSDISESDREQEALRYASVARQMPFDLAQGPLLRASVIRMGPDDQLLMLTMHHIVSDGWSMEVMLRELSALYAAYSQGKLPSLRELPVQYADFTLWQRQWLQGEVLEKQLSYWKTQLHDVAVLELPTDRPRPAVQSYRGRSQSIVLSIELTEELKRLGRREGVTLFMTLLAGFQILLHRYTGQDDIAVGSPIAGRTRPEIEGLIGFFVNTLVFRTDLSGDPTFRELLARVREIALRAYEHQDLPFEKLVEELNPDRNRSHSPLFQVLFAVQNIPRRELEMPGLVATPVEIQSSISKVDLFAAFIERDGQLTLRTEYNTDLFDEATIRRLTESYQKLLEGIVSAPDHRISELPILVEVERQRFLVGWNDTQRDYPEKKCIHELYAEQADTSPDAVALIDEIEDKQLSYRELNQRANQLAHHLKQFGVGADVLVAICMERSVEMVVGLLAILKAGGAYVPLDPSYPKERLAFMLQDSGAPVLITEQPFVALFNNHTVKIISPDTDWENIAQRSESNLAAETSSDSLAYVIYTSGSTGQPKGVAVSHRAVNRLVLNTDYAQLDSTDIVAQASNVSFDAATFEIWGALLNGARLVSIAKNTLLSPQSLSAAMERHGITTLFLTTALFNQMVEQIPAALGTLRYLLFGGEAVDAQRVRELLDHGPPSRLLHVYGPTETTTFASSYWVKSVAADATTVPIGRPIANTEIYILDAHLNPVPIGVSGELYIGGPGVARGYLNRPELTAAKFVANLFDHDPQAKLYRTGDLARYLPDGDIEFVGRIDNQVKIHGYRIELGEIEAVLNQQPAVRECVVLAREDTRGEKRVVAYVAAAPGITAAAELLRGSLQERLPDYMVPAAIVFIESLPLTPNGKVDRKALPNPETPRRNAGDGYVAPRTAAEKQLTGIWTEVLKVERVGVDDNFFGLGGHSLAAVRLVAEMEKRLGCQVPVALLFKLPTIARLAKELRPQAEQHSSPVLAVQPKGSIPPFFCVHGYNSYRHIARQLGTDRPFYGLGKHFSGRRVTRTRVDAQAQDHLKEIYAIQPTGPYYLAGHSIGGLIAYEIAQLLQRDGQEVAFLGLIDTIFPPRPSAASRRLCERVKKSWSTLTRLAAANRFGQFFQTVKASMQWRLKVVHCYGYHLIDKPLPSELLTFYVDEIVFRHTYAKEQRRYQPRPYTGRVHYFRAAQSLSDVEKWRLVTNRQLVVHEIPGNHLTMIEEAGARDLARSLKSCLEESVAGSPRLSAAAAHSNGAKSVSPIMALQRSAIRR